MKRRREILTIDEIQFPEVMAWWCEKHPTKKIHRNQFQTPIRYVCPECKEIFTKQSRPELFQ